MVTINYSVYFSGKQTFLLLWNMSSGMHLNSLAPTVWKQLPNTTLTIVAVAFKWS